MSAEEMIGCILLARSRDFDELKHLGGTCKKHELDYVLFKLIEPFDKISKQERAEVALYTILYCQLDGHSSLMFGQLVGPHTLQIVRDLKQIPDKVLRDRFSVNDKTIQRFRNYLEFMEENPVIKRGNT
jgi:hypothetical protein